MVAGRYNYTTASSCGLFSGFSTIDRAKLLFATQLLGVWLPRLRQNQARGSPRLVFTISQGKDGVLRVSKGDSRRLKAADVLLFGARPCACARSRTAAKSSIRRNNRRQPLPTFYPFRTRSIDHHFGRDDCRNTSILRALTTASRRQIPRRQGKSLVLPPKSSNPAKVLVRAFG